MGAAEARVAELLLVGRARAAAAGAGLPARRPGDGGCAAFGALRDTELDRIVAVKMLTPQLAKDPIFVARFHRAAK